MFPVSEWYTSLACYTFQTVFVRLGTDEIAAIVDGVAEGRTVDAVLHRLNRVIRALPGSSFIHADVCAPTDSPTFQRGSAIKTGRRGWEMLIESERVRAAFRDGQTERLALHPYRRMDPVKEFRIFVKGRRAVAMSQRQLDRHYRRLEGHKTDLWREGRRLAEEAAPFLPADNVALDVYFTHEGHLLLLDINPWGPPTDALLFRNWEHDWDAEPGLRLIPPPIKLKGDVEVSF